MKDQGDPITDDEWILRRVHRENFMTIDPPLVNPYAFRPQITGRFPDTTGISFYRQTCVSNYADILAKTDAAKRIKYGILRLPIAFLKSINLCVERNDDCAEPIVLGHVIMPGINSIEYVQDKDVVLPRMKTLADYVNEHREFLRLPLN
jgi:hypothetical protein